MIAAFRVYGNITPDAVELAAGLGGTVAVDCWVAYGLPPQVVNWPVSNKRYTARSERGK